MLLKIWTGVIGMLWFINLSCTNSTTSNICTVCVCKHSCMYYSFKSDKHTSFNTSVWLCVLLCEDVFAFIHDHQVISHLYYFLVGGCISFYTGSQVGKTSQIINNWFGSKEILVFYESNTFYWTKLILPLTTMIIK